LKIGSSSLAMPASNTFAGKFAAVCAVLILSWTNAAFGASALPDVPSLARTRCALERISNDPTSSRQDWQRVIQSFLDIHRTGKGPTANQALLLAGKASLRLYRRCGLVEDLDRAISYLSDFVKINHKGPYLVPALKELKAAHLFKRQIRTTCGEKASALPRAAARSAQPRNSARDYARDTSSRQNPSERFRSPEPTDAAAKTSVGAPPSSLCNTAGNPFFAAPAGSPGAVLPSIASPPPLPPPVTSAAIVPPTISDRTPPNRSGSVVSRRYVVVIDPGHGGKDPGAVSKDGKTKEKDVTLEIAGRIKEQLMEKAPGITIELTRSEDKFLSLQERTAIANSLDADLFLSIHCNGADDSVSKGVETFFLSKAGSRGAMRVAARENGIPVSKMSDLEATLVDLMVTAKKSESDRLANSVHRFLVQRLKKTHPSRDRGVKGAPFYVLLGAKMPAALIECAFISSRYEKERLTSASHLDAISRGIAEGAKSYLDGLGDKS